MKSKNYLLKAPFALLSFCLLILPAHAQELGMKGGITPSNFKGATDTKNFIDKLNEDPLLNGADPDNKPSTQFNSLVKEGNLEAVWSEPKDAIKLAITIKEKLLLENKTLNQEKIDKVERAFQEFVVAQYAKKDFHDYVEFTTRYERGAVFFPAKSSFQNKLIHGDINKENGSPVTFLNNGGINFTGKGESTTMSFFSELAAGYFGPFRVSLSMGNTETGTVQLDSAQISSYSDQQLDSLFKEINQASSSAKTIQNLLTSGGNGSLKVSVPFLWWKIGRMKFSKENKETEQMVIASNFFTRVSTMFPAFNRQIENPQFATEFGLEAVTAINFAATGDEKISALRFLGKFKAGGLFGSRYITSMGMDGSKAAFEFKAELGFAISDVLMISFNYMNIRQSSAVKTKISTIGLSFLNF